MKSDQMNDWLNYKGSGSSRAYTGDYTDSTMTHSLRDKIDYGVGVVMDTLTGADRKREAKQKEAIERLRQAQIESESKKLNEGATKLLKDAADLRKDAYEYHDKVNTSEKLAKQQDSVKDPRALAQIASAENNLDNDLHRMYVRINAKITTLREDYNKLNDTYNQYMLDSYPTNYIKGVPDKLRMADKFIKESAVPRSIDW